MDAVERKKWSHIGQPPQVVIDAPAPVTRAWKELVRKAKTVVKLRGRVSTEEWVKRAKSIEDERSRIIMWAERSAREGTCRGE
jgi:hypothetical protein